MSETTDLGIPYLESTDNVSALYTLSANLAAVLQALLDVPADVVASVNQTITVTSTSFAALPSPGPLTVSFTNPSSDYDLMVDVQFSAWLTASANDVRIGLAASGGLSFTPGTLGSGGAVANSDNPINANPTVHVFQEIPGLIIPAGAAAVTFALQGMRTTSGTQNVNYPVLRVKPRRYLVA